MISGSSSNNTFFLFASLFPGDNASLRTAKGIHFFLNILNNKWSKLHEKVQKMTKGATSCLFSFGVSGVVQDDVFPSTLKMKYNKRNNQIWKEFFM